MRTIAWVLLGAFFILLVFWVGLMINFPGAALSRLVETRISGGVPSLRAALSPASLGWSGIHFQTLRLSYQQQGEAAPLITLNDVSISLSWRLWSGLPVTGSLGEHGRFEVFVPWEAGGTFSISGAELPLERIPAIAVFTPVQVRGRLTFTGNAEWPGLDGKLRSFPAGTLIAKGEQLELLPFEVFGAKLPSVRLESMDIHITTGKQITFERFEFKGDLQGKITGTLRPRLPNFGRTNLQLRLAAAVRPEWLNRLGALQPLAQGFLKNGRFEGQLRGTIAKPSFRPGKGRS